MTCTFHKGENHTKCQNFTMHWVCQSHLRASNIERYKFKPDLNLQAELNVYLFQNGKHEPLGLVSVPEYLKVLSDEDVIYVLNI